MERKESTHSVDPTYGVSSPTTSPYVGDYEGIKVFRDDNELPVGEKIGPELLYSIMQSKISIPIISEDYASSKWCLCELTEMLKCKSNGGQIVLPIFYKVAPSQLRHLTGAWANAINAHKKNSDEMTVKRWEEALKEVSSLKGWESEKIDHGHGGQLVKIVVKEVMSKLRSTFKLIVPKEYIGLDNHVEEIMSLIGAKFDDTRIIGIYGMGGIGKTTLARVLYDNLSSRFEHLSFVANVRETSLRKGIEFLQKQLIHDILRRPHDVSNVYEGANVIRSRFTSKKVLILLDDIGDNSHLNAFVGNGRWFKAGSIVIITTRNKNILDNAKADPKYQLNELPLDQSLILFSRHAFKKDSIPSEYEVISRDVVSITGGLPLALEVIGSILCGKTKTVWQDTLRKLNEVPNKTVQEKLRISYEVLDDAEQQIFLDIACFFIGLSKQSPTYMWDACGFFPWTGIDTLRDMSLIKIDKDGKLMMHNQLRDLGREIVRLENTMEFEKRSRLWKYEDAIDVLDNNKGTRKIVALSLNKNGQGRSYTSKQFENLSNLRFLQVRAANLAGDFQNLLPRLRWLQWKDCPSDFAAANFHPKKLVVLDLSWSEILKDWRGWDPLKMAAELKVLNLSGHSLIRTPDLSDFKSLEILILEDCENLEEIHPSIEDIKTLVSLIVRRCWRLKELPATVGRMEELKELIINDSAIKEIPILTGSLSKLEILRASCCEYLAQLPESISSLVSLTQLDLSQSWIEELPESIGSLESLTQIDLSHSRIEELPASIGSLVLLIQMDLSHSRIKELPESMDSLELLTHLNLSYSCIKELPESLGSLLSLTHLDLSHSQIEELPESIGSLKKLKTLDASNCELLAHIPSSIGHLKSLQRLLLRKCHSLSEIPDSIGKLALLIELDLKSTAIVQLPESIGSLKELKILDASYCALLACVPNSIGHLASQSLLDLRFSLVSLQRLLLQECCLLREIPDSIGRLTSLTQLNLEHTSIAKLPESIGFLKELKTLNASYCASLTCIPSSIGHLASLSLLDLRFCRKLAQLPHSIGSLVSLQRLLLRECRCLTEIPNSIEKLTSLSELDLRRTGIAELTKSIGSLKELEVLDASYCASLAYIPNSIGHLTSLSLLDLRKCGELAQLPDSIGSLVSLKRLLLRRCCSLREIPNSIAKLTSLTELDLRSTAVVEIPKSIRNRQKLRILT
ncbi:disease resistance protein RPV1-like [Eucalyptus grandis]|uniref:disease resistance protein RPV1-like n=1 Tax=Eucalyptus grandis TaxID=71139 RepID=UPI00192EE3A1|nr:disease resistance protein RPV1-like [Eucalyptus grandis]